MSSFRLSNAGKTLINWVSSGYPTAAFQYLWGKYQEYRDGFPLQCMVGR